MVPRELLSPADLSGAQAFCIHKTMEVIVVCKDENLIFAVLQVVALSLEYLNNSKKLTAMGLVSSLYRNHFPRKKCYWMQLAQIGLSDYPI